MGKPYLLVETNLGNFKWYLPTIDASSMTFSEFSKFSYSEYCAETERLFTLDMSDCDVFYSHSADKPANESLLEYFNPTNNPSIRPGGGYWKIGNAQGTWTLRSTTSDYEFYTCPIYYNNTLICTIEYMYYTSTNFNNQARIQFPFVYDTTTGKIMVITAGDNFTIIQSNTSLPYRFYLRSTYSINSNNSLALNEAIGGSVPIEPDGEPDPYGPDQGGGYSGTGGGPGTGGQTGTGGNYDTSSDPIPVPGLPTSITTGSGLFTAYNPSASQLANFANKLWNRDPTTIDDWFRMLFGGDAFNSIIGLSLIPVAPSTGSSKNILLGNWDTGASAPVINSQYVEVNFGSLTLSEFWGNSIDYSPYTRVQLALPYIGIVDVDTDDVIGSVNTLTYHIDVFSGAICAMLHCVKGELSSVIYQWSGSCGVTLPITGQSFNAVISAIMGVGAAALGGIAMASGPVGAAIGTAGSLALGTGAVTGAAANMFGTMKGKVQKSGSFNASSGALGIMTPYFIITRPVQSIPSTQQATKGYPSNISAHLGDLLGYTEVTEVHLHNIPGTKDEVLEIESLLKKGVIF